MNRSVITVDQSVDYVGFSFRFEPFQSLPASDSIADQFDLLRDPCSDSVVGKGNFLLDALDSPPESISPTRSIGKIYEELSTNWKKETRGMSTVLHMTMNNNYLGIIGLGPAVIPFILRDMERSPDHWFVALRHLARALVGEEVDPVPVEDRGDIERMTAAWLTWGRNCHLL